MSVQVGILPKIIARIDNERELGAAGPDAVLDALALTFGARTRFALGQHVLEIAGLQATSPTSGLSLINAWKARATRVIAEQAR